MYPVSQEFNDKVLAPVRKVYGKVQVDYTDPFIDQSIATVTSEEANISYPYQTADNVKSPIGKILSLDGSCSLDGTYVLAPTPDGAQVTQMGWWGSQLAGIGGVFVETYPTLSVNFISRPILRLSVVGDSARAEYPVEFDINLYNSTDALLYTETVIGNTLIEWQKVLDIPVTQVTKMELIITKWSHEGRQVKIMEFYTSIQEVYEGEDVLSIQLMEEREVGNNTLPVGSISANEVSIKLNNQNRKFDAGNTQSPLYETLKTNRRIKAWLGIEKDDLSKEFVPLGTFWSGDWNVPEQDVYAQTTGRDRLELLRKSTYSTSQAFQNTTLYDLAENVLIDAGLTIEEYYIDPELQQFIVPYSYFDNQSHREALRKIAEACVGQVYCDREGIIRVEGPSAVSNIVESAITPEDYFSKDNPVKWSQVANYIEVETQPLRPDVLQEVYKSNEPISIGTNETKTITAYYNHTPCINAVASITGTGTIVNSIYYAWGATIKVASTAVGTFELVINAQPLKVLNKDKIVRKDDDSIVDMGTLKYTFPSNPLVQTVVVAEVIADKLLSSFKNPRRDVEVDWRGNPALLLGDRVKVTDDREQNQYNVTRQELEFDGTLNAKLSGRRA